MKHSFIISIFLLLFANWSVSQRVLHSSKFDSLDTYSFPESLYLDSAIHTNYPFIDLHKNNFQFFSSTSPNWERFYTEFDAMVKQKDRKLSVYHLGGSHIQADIYSHDFRSFLQQHWEDIPGERGIVFPFNLAKTNNPANYSFTSPNSWTGFRSVVKRPTHIDFGVTGAAIVCADSLIQIQFRHNRTVVQPAFNKVRIFHNKGAFPFTLHLGDCELLVTEKEHNPRLGYTDICFSDPIQTMDIEFARNTSDTIELLLSGFQFSNDFAGFSYTSIGINGAGLYTYLDNKNFKEQLSLYPPDLFLFSVGTNDGNVPYDKFEPQVYKNNLEKMMKLVLETNPSCAILLTVPNDSYYHRKYLNRNIARQREVIQELAAKYKMPVWDFYGIMGELGSSKTWQSHGLMQSDKVHFTGVGYHLKGDLLIDAFQKFLVQMGTQEKQN